jgi:hypothetical protein
VCALEIAGVKGGGGGLLRIGIAMDAGSAAVRMCASPVWEVQLLTDISKQDKEIM